MPSPARVKYSRSSTSWSDRTGKLGQDSSTDQSTLVLLISSYYQWLLLFCVWSKIGHKLEWFMLNNATFVGLYRKKKLCILSYGVVCRRKSYPWYGFCYSFCVCLERLFLFHNPCFVEVWGHVAWCVILWKAFVRGAKPYMCFCLADDAIMYKIALFC